jgi:Putative peptidoglycan binding domain
VKTPAIATAAAALSLLMMASANAQFRNFRDGPIPFGPMFGPRDEPPPDYLTRRRSEEPPPGSLMRGQRDQQFQQPQVLQGRGQRLETPPVAQASPQRSEPVAATVSLMQLNMEAVPRLTSDGVRKIQQLLKDRGLSPGPIDGVAGPLTNAAIREFQGWYGIKARGEIDNQTLFAIGAVDLAGAN